MGVQNKRPDFFLGMYIFDENSHTCSARTRITQSGLMFSRQIQSNKAAVRFLVMHTGSELNKGTLSWRLTVCAAILAWQTRKEMPETLLFSSSKRLASVLLIKILA